MPLLVYLLEFGLSKVQSLANLLIFFLLVGGAAINYAIIYSNNMSAGLFAPQDIYIFNLWLNKPYSKLPSVALGILMARAFMSLNKLKIRHPRQADKVKSLSFFGSGFVATFCFLACFGLIALICTLPLSANKDPTSWSKFESAIFVSLSRPLFLLCLICWFYLLWVGHSALVKTVVTWRVWGFLSKLSYLIYLLFPIIAGNFSSSMSNPLYLTYSEMIYLMVFNIAASLFFSVIIYLLVESPAIELLK
mmetsp:Transcript_14415/g.24579  ORF Transcript_14415/g.24579 Transcript_14415/m.24579 type:complete len:249 (-) Transcript_14415:17-763(-)